MDQEYTSWTKSFISLEQAILTKIKTENPLILTITNVVTVNDVANAIIMIGGSPAMGSDGQDSVELQKLAGAVALNLGGINHEHLTNINRLITLLPAKPETWHPQPVTRSDVTPTRLWEQVQKNKQVHLPYTLDLVAYGATPTRITLGQKLLRQQINVIKGNYSEINALINQKTIVKGVDASGTFKNPAKVAATVAQKYHVLVLMTGKNDFVSDGVSTFMISGGNTMLSQITGTGCILNGLLATFMAIAPTLSSIVCCSLLMKQASVWSNTTKRQSQPCSQGPYSFRTYLFDNLYTISQEPQILNELTRKQPYAAERVCVQKIPPAN